jgi:hypothetical protein
VAHKPIYWFRYVDDTLIIWPHGQEKLTEFLNHHIGLHNNIQFTMKKEDSHLPFLDIDIYRKMDSSLGHKSLLEAHPYESFPTPELISPSCKQTISPHFPDTQSRSSL